MTRREPPVDPPPPVCVVCRQRIQDGDVVQDGAHWECGSDEFGSPV